MDEYSPSEEAFNLPDGDAICLHCHEPFSEHDNRWEEYNGTSYFVSSCPTMDAEFEAVK